MQWLHSCHVELNWRSHLKILYDFNTLVFMPMFTKTNLIMKQTHSILWYLVKKINDIIQNSSTTQSVNFPSLWIFSSTFFSSVALLTKYDVVSWMTLYQYYPRDMMPTSLDNWGPCSLLRQPSEPGVGSQLSLTINIYVSFFI